MILVTSTAGGMNELVRNSDRITLLAIQIVNIMVNQQFCSLWKVHIAFSRNAIPKHTIIF